MSEKPILFSGEMIRAILDGRKTQTRRVWKKPKRHANNDVYPVRAAGRFELASGGFCIGETIHCPYGQPGDRLWVRETWAANSLYDNLKPSEVPPDDTSIWYKAGGKRGYAADSQRGKWRPSIFMPR